MAGHGAECSDETLMSDELTVGVVSGNNIRCLLSLLTLPVGVCSVQTWCHLGEDRSTPWNSGIHTVSSCCSGGNSQAL